MSPLRSSAGPAVCDERDVELGGEDLRQRRLAQAGRAGEQDVVERLAARGGGLERDRELLLERRPGRRSRRGAAGAASGRGRPRRRAAGVWIRGVAHARAARSALRRAAPRRVSPVGAGQQRARPPAACSRARRGRRARAAAGRRRGATVIALVGGDVVGTPTFSRSSTMIRSAVRLPMPGTACSRATSPAASAPTSSRGEPPREHRRAPPSGRRTARRAAAGTGRAPPRWRSRRATARRRGRPGGCAARPAGRRRGRGAASRRRRRGGSRRPTRSRPRRGRGGARRPRRRRARSSRPPATALRQRRVVGVADRDRERVGGVVGRGALGQRRAAPATIRATWSLSARPVPQTAALTCCGV